MFICVFRLFFDFYVFLIKVFKFMPLYNEWILCRSMSMSIVFDPTNTSPSYLRKVETAYEKGELKFENPNDKKIFLGIH